MSASPDQVLRSEIERIIMPNIDDRKIVLYELLKEVVTLEKVKSVIAIGRAEDYERQKIAEEIYLKGLRTFATLIMIEEPDLIYSYWRFDSGVSVWNPDEKLPLEFDDLDKSFGKEATRSLNWRERFVEFQYIFAIPMFTKESRHRDFSDKIRLPFLAPGETAPKRRRGAFGEVSKVRLPRSRASRNSQNQEYENLVKKRLVAKGGGKYKEELRCLQLLNLTKHACIVELSGSYSQDGSHNFLFPEANSGDLYDLITRDPRPDEFKEDESFFLAMCGLASALKELHNYTNKELDIELIGCHHDLKPRNVLVDKASFILTDFGLSEMSSAKQGFKEEDYDRDLYFNAPENFDYKTFSKQDAGPSGDIWSLGCIFAVVFAYIKGGATEVQNFKEKRTYEMDPRGIIETFKSFHKGGEENPGVSEWLNGNNWHEKSPTEHTAAEKDLLALIRDMLSIDPIKRPRIGEVVRRLRCITLKKAAEPVQIDKLAHSLNLDQVNMDYTIERYVLLEWLKRIDSKSNAEQLFLKQETVFGAAYNLVRNIVAEFRVLTSTIEHERPLFAQLRKLNEELILYLEPNSRYDVRADAERNVLPTVSQDNEQVWLEEDGGKRLLLPTANVRQLMRDPGRLIKLIDRDRVKLAKNMDEESQLGAMVINDILRTFRIGTLTDDTGSLKPVIVEELKFMGSNFNDQEMSKQIVESLEQILSLGLKEAAQMQALSCAGMYNDEKHSIIGLVYSYPESVSILEPRPNVRSLVELFSEYKGISDHGESFRFVGLDDRLELACDLAAAVFRFHALGWWHKDISSYNVLFFDTKLCTTEDFACDPDSDAPPFPDKLLLGTPALIGFSHSRPGEAVYSNKMHILDETLAPYRHPAYAGADTNEAPTLSYRPQYDYYSLGLVLLEIGLWRSIASMLGNPSPPDTKEDKRLILLNEYVPFLAATMGNVYATAVKMCLTEGALTGKSEGSGQDNNNVDKEFERLVLRPLHKLSLVMSLKDER